MITNQQKDDYYYCALKECLTALFPECVDRMGSKTALAKLYVYLINTQQLTKNDKIMQAVSQRYNQICPNGIMSNITAAQYFCKKFKQYALEMPKLEVMCDDNIAMLIDYLSQ